MLVNIMPGGDTAVEGEGRLDGCGLQEVNALGENGRRKRWSLSVVPARAGMTPTPTTPGWRPLCGPRTSGDDPGFEERYTLVDEWSPHERG